MELMIFGTGNCFVDCDICCMYENPSEFASIGRNKTERKGIEKLVNSLDKDSSVLISGGDPMLNMNLLEIVSNLNIKKRIVINPISFLTYDLKKRGSEITKKDYESVFNKQKYSNRTLKAVKYLSRFDDFYTSSGTFQGPNEETVKFGNNYFINCVSRLIESNNFHINKRMKKEFDEDGNLSGTVLISLIGKMRENIENGKTSSPHILNPNEIIEFDYPCLEGLPEDINIFFKKENRRKRMYFMMCCMENSNPYIAVPSNLYLDDFANMKDDSVLDSFNKEIGKWRKSNLYQLFNSRFFLKPFNKCQNADLSRWKRFDEKTKYARKSLVDQKIFFRQKALDLIYERTNISYDLMQNTYTMNDGLINSCNLCETTGHLLRKAGIGQSEWYEYINSEIDKERDRNFNR